MGKRSHHRRRQALSGHRPAVGALVALAIALGGCSAGRSASLEHPAATSVPPASTTSVATRTYTTPAPSLPASTTTTGPKPTVGKTAPDPKTTPTTASDGSKLGPGDSGPAVLQLQQRLSALGYWLGTPDGTYGGSTSQAVLALQKAAGIGRDGVFGAATVPALSAGTKPTPKSTAGRVIEVDLPHQLVLVVTDGRVNGILNASTGGGYRFSVNGRTSVAITPTGHFTTFRQIDGRDVSPLGVLWRPKYFVGGIALHGDSSVPTFPASHGCVRVSNQAIDWIWAANLDPIGTSVWVY